MIKNLMLFALMLSMAFAWTSGYEPPPCVDAYAVLGYNFTATTNGTTYACVSSNWRSLVPWAAAYAQGVVSGKWANSYAKTSGTNPAYAWVNYTLGNASSKNYTATGTATANATGWADNNQTTESSMTIELPFPCASTSFTMIEQLSAEPDWIGSYQQGNVSAQFSTSPTLWFNHSIATSTAGTVTKSQLLNVTCSGANYMLSDGTGSYSSSDHSISISIRTNTSHTAPPTRSGATRATFNITGSGQSSGTSWTENSSWNTTNGYPDYISLNGNKTIRSDFKTGTTAIMSGVGFMRALLYFGDTIITPLISYDLSNATMQFYNSSGYSFIRNNTIAYVFDAVTGQWYIVPAYSAQNFGDVYTLGTFLFQEQGNMTPSITIPKIPVALSCVQDADSYNIDASWSDVGTQTVYYGNNDTRLIYSITNASLHYSVDTTLYPLVNYTYNGVQKCGSNGGSLLGITLPSMGDALKPFQAVLFLSMMAVSAVIPFALIFPVIINDAFSLMPVVEMALLVVLTGVVSAFVNHKGELSLKSLVVYIIFGMAIMLYYMDTGGMSGTSAFTGINSAFNDLSDIVSGNSGEGAFLLFAIPATAVNLLVQLGLFLIALPLQFGGILTSLIGQISPQLGSAITLLRLDVAFSIGATAFILLKLYEVISNRQLRV